MRNPEELEMQERVDSLLKKIGSIPSQNCNADMTIQPTIQSNSQDPGDHALKDSSFYGLVHTRNAGKLGRNMEMSKKYNEFWYLDYYDPDFNNNPWQELERANGLEPVEGMK